MPRHTHSYRLHKGSGQAVVTLGGKTYYLGKYDSPQSHREYARVLSEWQTTAAVAPASPGHMVLSEVAERFLAHVNRYYRRPDGTATSEVNGFCRAVRLLSERYGDSTPAEFGPMALKSLRQVWIDQGLARRTVNALSRKIVRLFSWAEENELVPRGITHTLREVKAIMNDFRCPAKRDKKIEAVPLADVEAILPFLSTPARAIVELLRYTAARAGEICLLRTADLVTCDKVWEYRPSHHKLAYRNQERVILLGPQAQAILTPWLRPNEPERFLFRPVDSWREMVGADNRGSRAPGERYSVSYLGVAVKVACERAGVPKFTLHQIRHAQLSAIRAACGRDAAQRIAGHHSGDVTEGYAPPDDSQARDAVHKIG